MNQHVTELTVELGSTDCGWQDFERLDRDDARPEVAVYSFGVGTAHPRKPIQTRFVVCDWTPVSNEINHLRTGSVELKGRGSTEPTPAKLNGRSQTRRLASPAQSQMH